MFTLGVCSFLSGMNSAEVIEANIYWIGSLMTACVLVLNGSEVDEAFQKIEIARGCSVPDTQEQRQWVAWIRETT